MEGARYSAISFNSYLLLWIHYPLHILQCLCSFTLSLISSCFLYPSTGQEASPVGSADAAGQQDEDWHHPHADPKGHAGHRAVWGQPKYLSFLCFYALPLNSSFIPPATLSAYKYCIFYDAGGNGSILALELNSVQSSSHTHKHTHTYCPLQPSHSPRLDPYWCSCIPLMLPNN